MWSASPPGPPHRLAPGRPEVVGYLVGDFVAANANMGPDRARYVVRPCLRSCQELLQGTLGDPACAPAPSGVNHSCRRIDREDDRNTISRPDCRPLAGPGDDHTVGLAWTRSDGLLPRNDPRAMNLFHYTNITGSDRAPSHADDFFEIRMPLTPRKENTVGDTFSRQG